MGSYRPRGRREGPTRRQALVAAALMVSTSAGCSLRLERAGPRPAPTPTPTLTPDDVARARLAATADVLGAAALALQRARPALRAALAVVVADHRAHAVAARPMAAGSGSPATARTPTSTPPSVTRATPGPTLAALIAAEQAAATAALADLADVGPVTARLLASVAAALQVHVELLRPLR